MSSFDQSHLNRFSLQLYFNEIGLKLTHDLGPNLCVLRDIANQILVQI